MFVFVVVVDAVVVVVVVAVVFGVVFVVVVVVCWQHICCNESVFSTNCRRGCRGGRC